MPHIPCWILHLHQQQKHQRKTDSSGTTTINITIIIHTYKTYLSQFILLIGLWILTLGSYANLYGPDNPSHPQVHLQDTRLEDRLLNVAEKIPGPILAEIKDKMYPGGKIPAQESKMDLPILLDDPKTKDQEVPKMEPKKVEKDKAKDDSEKAKKDPEKSVPSKKEVPKVDNNPDNNIPIHSDAIKKEESELAAAKLDDPERHEDLKETLEKYKQKQLEMIQVQNEFLKNITELQKTVNKELQEKEKVKLKVVEESNKEDEAKVVKMPTEKVVVETPDAPKLENANASNKSKSEDEKKKTEEAKFPEPIVLKMNNQTKARINESSEDKQSVQRDILEHRETWFHEVQMLTVTRV